LDRDAGFPGWRLVDLFGFRWFANSARRRGDAEKALMAIWSRMTMKMDLWSEAFSYQFNTSAMTKRLTVSQIFMGG